MAFNSIAWSWESNHSQSIHVWHFFWNCIRIDLLKRVCATSLHDTNFMRTFTNSTVEKCNAQTQFSYAFFMEKNHSICVYHFCLDQIKYIFIKTLKNWQIDMQCATFISFNADKNNRIKSIRSNESVLFKLFSTYKMQTNFDQTESFLVSLPIANGH